MALKNLETARKKAATHEREAQIQRAEKEAQAKPDDPQASYNLARLYTFYGKKELAYERLTKALKQRFQTRLPRSHRALVIVKDTEVIVGKKISPLDTDGFSVCLHRIFNPIRAFQNFPVNSFKNVTAV